MRQLFCDLTVTLIICLLFVLVYFCIKITTEVSIVHHNTNAIISILESWELDE